MNINERLFQTMKLRKITQENLANALNTSQSVIAGWKNRGTIPSIEYLPIICEVLDISWEYLVTGEESNEYYTTEEKRLVEQFRGTDDTGKKRIMEYVQDMRRLHPEQEREPETEAKIS